MLIPWRSVSCEERPPVPYSLRGMDGNSVGNSWEGGGFRVHGVLQGPQYLPLLWLHTRSVAIVSDTSDRT